MRRRKAVKAIALGTVTPHLLLNAQQSGKISSTDQGGSFQSPWHNWPDMRWVGPDYWGNRLQDWEIQNGKAVCVVADKDRSLHCLTCELTHSHESFETQVSVERLNAEATTSGGGQVGFVLGAKGPFEDYRSAAVFGKGLRAGISGDGKLFIGSVTSEENITVDRPILLTLRALPTGNHYTLHLTAIAQGAKNKHELVVSDIPAKDLTGNIALFSHFADVKELTGHSSVGFSRWEIKGPKVAYDARRAFGPVCFAQYTLNKKILKLNAQLAPVENVGGHRIFLEIKQGDRWQAIQESKMDLLGRSAHFRVENWSHHTDIPYRVKVVLPLKNGTSEYFYEGTVAREPLNATRVKMAVFSCNCDHGFPDSDVPLRVRKHSPDVAVFLGDQFYESTGGFSIQTSPLEKSSLDYLRKWLMFGWSYREIFRNIPCAFIPDDHDVYHGNVWGAGGKKASTESGWGYEAQDQGGYKMPSEWVNMVQRTQTSHLPDPYDPAPVNQGIGVYFTSWNYAGISMAILEDRKFKSAPKYTLPAEAKVVNGFIQNPDFDVKAYYDVEADLLGSRQMKFLNEWISDWNDGSEMKAVLSQTNFCTVATLPKGSIIDSIVPRLPIPAEGEYVKGDAPTTDMDSNGWPQKGRDEALSIIRKCFAFHIAGDQHLASVVHYGIEEFRDAGYAFAGPALNNIFPRRWWPPVDQTHRPLAGQPDYTGNFQDGFGNKVTVMAVANPRLTNRQPAIIHNRATGYGMVTFDKEERTIKVECWPRYADPDDGPNGQYKGWPIVVKQEENYGRTPAGYLATLEFDGVKDPVIQIINEVNGEVEYVLRVKGNRFRPKIFSASSYTVRVYDPDTGKEKIINGQRIARSDRDLLRVRL